MQQDPQIPDDFKKISFRELIGWQADDHLAAFRSFSRFCENPEAAGGDPATIGATGDHLAALCSLAKKAPPETGEEARHFFETWFTPYRVPEKGFVTGYFEPELAASRVRTDEFTVPLHKKPAGLEAVPADDRPAGWPPHLSHGRRQGGQLAELPDRGAIMDGALDREKLELVWLADPIDAYFVHVQGSARLRLSDGSVMRVGYAGKSGHPYTGIGRLLVKRGEGTPEDFTMSGLRAWLDENPDQRDPLFKENRSYIFFREVIEARPDEGPIGAAGLALVAGRSLAVDETHIPYGALVFVNAGFKDPDKINQDFARLLVADDTGSAINGPARGDVFTGSGREAGDLAGDIRHPATFTILVPKTGAVTD